MPSVHKECLIKSFFDMQYTCIVEICCVYCRNMYIYCVHCRNCTRILWKYVVYMLRIMSKFVAYCRNVLRILSKYVVYTYVADSVEICWVYCRNMLHIFQKFVAYIVEICRIYVADSVEICCVYCRNMKIHSCTIFQERLERWL